MASVAGQWVQPARCSVVHVAGRVRPAARGVAARAAGRRDTGAAGARLLRARSARAGALAEGCYADSDSLAAGERTRPLLKPRADPWLLRSGLLTRGRACFILSVRPHDRADAARGAAAGEARAVRPDACARHPAAAVAAAASPPMRRAPWPMVSIVIATSAAGRSTCCAACAACWPDRLPRLGSAAGGLSVDPDDAVQRQVLAPAAGCSRVRVLDLGMATFNYAAVNNAAAQARDSGALLLLLNDDVMPLRRDWLQAHGGVHDGGRRQAADLVGAAPALRQRPRAAWRRDHGPGQSLRARIPADGA